MSTHIEMHIDNLFKTGIIHIDLKIIPLYIIQKLTMQDLRQEVIPPTIRFKQV